MTSVIKNVSKVGALAAAAALAGCGGSGSSGGLPAFISQPITNGSSAPIGNLFATGGGDTLAATQNQAMTVRGVSAHQNTDNGGVIQANSAATFSYDAANERLTVVFDGQALVFNYNATANGLTADGNSARLYDGNGELFATAQLYGTTIPNLQAGNTSLNYTLPMRLSVDNGANTKRVWGVAGRPTQSGSVPNSASASYDGIFVLENFYATGDSETDKVRYQGTTAATVNFSADTVSGSFNVTDADAGLGNNSGLLPSQTSLPFSGTVSGNEISASFNSADMGTLVVNPASNNSNTITGQFFGPSAQEIGGTIQFDGSINGTTVISSGVFAAGQ